MNSPQINSRLYPVLTAAIQRLLTLNAEKLAGSSEIHFGWLDESRTVEDEVPVKGKALLMLDLLASTVGNQEIERFLGSNFGICAALPETSRHTDHQKVAEFLIKIDYPEDFLWSHELSLEVLLDAHSACFLVMGLNLPISVSEESEHIGASATTNDALAGKESCTKSAWSRCSTFEILLLKYHRERCVKYLSREKFHVSRKILRFSKKFEFRVSSRFDESVAELEDYHEGNWVNKSLTQLWLKWHRFKTPNIHADTNVPMIFSIEILDKNTATLVAAEIGVINGAVYTSMTGWKNASGCGTLQMRVVESVLIQSGCKIWDLGMEIPYKLDDLKAEVVTRKRFYEDTTQASALENINIEAFDRRNCYEILHQMNQS